MGLVLKHRLPANSGTYQATSLKTTDAWSLTSSLGINNLHLPLERLLPSEDNCPKPFQFKTICMPHGMRLGLRLFLVERIFTTIFVTLKISFTCIIFVPDTELSTVDTKINGTHSLTLNGSQSSTKESIFKSSIKLKKINSIKCWRRYGELELSYIADESVKLYFGKLVVPYEVKHFSTL